MASPPLTRSKTDTLDENEKAIVLKAGLPARQNKQRSKGRTSKNLNSSTSESEDSNDSPDGNTDGTLSDLSNFSFSHGDDTILVDNSSPTNISSSDPPLSDDLLNNTIFNLEEIPPIAVMAKVNKSSIKPRELLVTIPIFSGSKTHADFRDFTLACNDAKKLLEPTIEGDFVQLLKTRLRDGALQAVRDEEPKTINELIKLLQNIYLPKKSSLMIIGELTRLFQKSGEDAASFYHRVQSKRSHIIETYLTENNDTITDEMKKHIEQTCCNSFVLGLKKEISALIKEKDNLNKAGPEAIRVENQLSLQDSIRNLSLLNMCTLCETTDHTAEECPIEMIDGRVIRPKCHHCGLKDHSPGNCPIKNKPDKIICQLCRNEGHEADECKKNVNPQKNDVSCQLCHRMGHEASNCRFPRNNNRYPKNNDHRNSNPLKCNICKRIGHDARYCRQNTNRSRDECQICHEIGHRADECHFYSQVHVTQTTPRCAICKRTNHSTQDCFLKNPCSICNKTGHSPSYCTQKSRKNNNECQICQSPIHSARDCPSFKLNSSTHTNQPQNSVQCQICSKYGHSALNCYQFKNKNEPQPSGSSGNSSSLPGGEARITHIRATTKMNH